MSARAQTRLSRRPVSRSPSSLHSVKREFHEGDDFGGVRASPPRQLLEQCPMQRGLLVNIHSVSGWLADGPGWRRRQVTSG